MKKSALLAINVGPTDPHLLRARARTRLAGRRLDRRSPALVALLRHVEAVQRGSTASWPGPRRRSTPS